MLLSHFVPSIGNVRPATGRKQTGMSRIWRIIAPVAIAGGLIAAGVMPAQAASPAVQSVTISATSPNYPGAVHGKVDGFAVAIYKTSFRHWNTALISGTVSGAVANDTATLLAKPFGAKTFTPTGTPITLTGGSQPISIKVVPSLATVYEVQVMTGPTVDATSNPQTVYVTQGVNSNHARKSCSRTTCTFSYHFFELMPSSAYNTEVKKHVYLYERVGYPRLPKFFTLSTTAKASRARRINAGEFERLLTFYIKLRNGGAAWFTLACTKDTESRDGIGLPGSHGCGAKRVNAKAPYIG
jgi:hypothetical protein